MEKLKHLLKELRDKKDKLDETASDLPKTEGRPIIDEKFKDLKERFEKLDNTVNDKKEQVFSKFYTIKPRKQEHTFLKNRLARLL